MNCLACFHWRRRDEYWGACGNRQGIELDPSRGILFTREDFCCQAFSEKFQVISRKYSSEKVEPQRPWDQGGDVNPKKIH